MNIHESLECLSDAGADVVRRRCVKTCAATLGGVLLAVLLLIGHAIGSSAMPEHVVTQHGGVGRE